MSSYSKTLFILSLLYLGPYSQQGLWVEIYKKTVKLKVLTRPKPIRFLLQTSYIFALAKILENLIALLMEWYRAWFALLNTKN